MNIMPSTLSVPQLRSKLALAQRGAHVRVQRFATGHQAVDRRLGELGGADVHEVFAHAPDHAAPANGFGLGLALRSSQGTIAWIMETRRLQEAGDLHGPGLGAWGLEPDRLLLVRVKDATGLLAAGEEALRSGAAGAVMMTGWGEKPSYGLTASRRLAMAAHIGGTACILVRIGASPQPSAAETRWSVEAAPSRALAAGAPGRPAFLARLLRSRSGAQPGEWIMEWNGETRSFVEPAASGGMVSVPADRPAASRAA